MKKFLFLVTFAVLAVVLKSVAVGTISGPSSVCVGQSITLSCSTSGGTWSSSAAMIASVGSSIGIVSGASSGVAVITYTDGTGFTTATVTVLPLPAAIAGTLAACPGHTTSLSNMTPGGTWSSSSTSTATIGLSTGIVTGIAAGTSAITYAIPTGCYRQATVTVNAAPTAIIGAYALCIGGTTSFACATAGGAWSSSDASIASIGAASGIVTSAASGTCSITYTLPTGCFTSTVVTVSTCTCSGVPYAGIVSSSTAWACIGSSFTLATLGCPPGVTYQWQSSPDSVIWSNITGATGASYSAAGISSTRYFRSVVTCTASGLSAVNPGRKVTHSTCCTGTFTAGTAVASTSYCSNCDLTLDLAGATTGSGVLYQWQRSPLGAGWSNIPGGTSASFTFPPFATSYYRCKVQCAASGSSVFSSSVYVAYRHLITADSIYVPDTACSSMRFYVEVSGLSPLLALKTFYGDGTSDSLPVGSAGGSSFINYAHGYTYSGTYSVRQILYNDNVPQDTVDLSVVFTKCKLMSLKFYGDANGNCIKDGTEPFSNIPALVQVDSAGVPVDSIFATSGMYYHAYGPAGTVYSFRLLTIWNISCGASGYIYDTVLAIGSSVTKYVGLSCATSPTDMAVYAIVPVTGRHDQWGHVYAVNYSCLPADATVTLNYSPKYSDFVNTHIPPVAAYGNTVVWHAHDLSVFSPPADFYYAAFSPWSALLTAGDTVHEQFAIAATTSTDINPENNIVIKIDTVLASGDPNFISVNPPGCFDNDTTFTFTVHFENTGTDTAHNIYVLDTLSPYLDPSSLEIKLASHEMYTAKYREGGHTIFKFDFPNIKLLDSSHHGLCDGAFIYTVHNKPGMGTGASINSRVGIYFDYNDVVLTNTVTNTKGCPVVNGVAATTASPIPLSPNPATDLLTITTNGTYTSFTITNSMGQTMMQQELSGTQSKVNVKALPAGVYMVSFRGEQGSRVERFVKW
ncbi:MAG: T9SS type A sorting domain-containing protein [Bacteroidota bacterium]